MAWYLGKEYPMSTMLQMVNTSHCLSPKAHLTWNVAKVESGCWSTVRLARISCSTLFCKLGFPGSPRFITLILNYIFKFLSFNRDVLSSYCVLTTPVLWCRGEPHRCHLPTWRAESKLGYIQYVRNWKVLWEKIKQEEGVGLTKEKMRFSVSWLSQGIRHCENTRVSEEADEGERLPCIPVCGGTSGGAARKPGAEGAESVWCETREGKRSPTMQGFVDQVWEFCLLFLIKWGSFHDFGWRWNMVCC